jgi:hypothetical protein
MKYTVILERFEPEHKVCKYESKMDGIEAINQLKDINELFKKEIAEGWLKVYLIIE